MHIIYTQTDILEFLGHMQDETPNVVFLLNGIDGFVIPGREYHAELAREIERVLSPGEAVLSCGSEDSVDWFWSLGLEVASDFPDSTMLIQLWMKKKIEDAGGKAVLK